MRPTFLLLGAGKCGTTTLHHWLGQHPEVLASREKEPPFFDAEYERGMRYYWERYFAREWSGERQVGESRPSKLMLPFVADRVRAALPEAKLIALLRDPVARAFSHWWHKYCEPWERLPFHRALEAELAEIRSGPRFEGEDGARRWRHGLTPRLDATRLRTYLEGGHYDEHLERYLGQFPRQQLLVVITEELAASPEVELRRIWRFLGVDESFVPPDLGRRNEALPTSAIPFVRVSRSFGIGRRIPSTWKAPLEWLLRATGSPPRLGPAEAKWLTDYYAPRLRRVREILGRDPWPSRAPAT